MVRWFVLPVALLGAACGAAPDDGAYDAARPDARSNDAGRDALSIALDGGAPGEDAEASAPSSLDLHDVTLHDNPATLADWPVTTLITSVTFRPGDDGVEIAFSKRDGPGSWPDVTPPGWDGPLEYTLGIAENINGQWHASAAIQFWRGLQSSGGNVASDPSSKGQCSKFGQASSCQVAVNWYYDARWGALAGRQPATGEQIGIFVVAGNVRGVKDGSQSPVQERSNVVLVKMPDVNGAQYTF